MNELYKIITGKYDSEFQIVVGVCIYVQILCMLPLQEGINLN